MRPNPPAMRRLRAALLAAVLACVAAPVVAQDATDFAPRTGDAWVDGRLADINRYGRAYRDPFVDELVRYHGAPRDLVVELLTRRGWTPGDVYFACALAAQVGRPCRAVADEYERDRGEGWGVLAKRLGIEPGSPRFHALKRGFVPTYDRWARPLLIDRDLARDFPGRRIGPPAAATRPDPDGRGDGRSGAEGRGGDRDRVAPPGRGGPAKREDRGRGGGKGKGRGKDGG